MKRTSHSNVPYPIQILPFSMHKGLGSHSKMDKNNVLMSRVLYSDDYVYHATAIASYAICSYSDDKVFFEQIQWIVDNVDKNGAIYHNFDVHSYSNIEKPWIGGLAQGLSAYAVVLAYEKTQDSKYIDHAMKMLDCIHDKCIYTDDNSNKWIMEYPGVYSILNGNIYPLFGIMRYLKDRNDTRLKKLLDSCINTLSKNLYRYDLGNWSLYDLHNGYPATRFYNNVHIEQLLYLFNIYKDGNFLRYALKWDRGNVPLRIKYMRYRNQIKRNGYCGMFKKSIQYVRWLR